MHEVLSEASSELLAAGILLALLGLVRIFSRGEIARRCRLPTGLLLLYALLSVAIVLIPEAPGTWAKAESAARLASSFVLALACVLTAAIFVFDLFMGKLRRHPAPRILRDTAVLGVYAVTCFLVLGYSDTDLTSVIATSTVLTAVVGFALQDLLSNVIAGLALQAEQPFERGDWIGFDDQEGVVLELNWRSTKLMTLHNDVVVIPNSVITKARVVNFTSPSPIHRRRFVVGLRYEVPPNRAKASILAAVRSVSDVLAHPAPYVQLLAFDDFSINYRVNFYIDDFRRREGIEEAVRTRLWYQLKRDGLSIPFPIRDVFLRNVDEGTLDAEERREREERVELLRKVPILSPLSDEEVRQLAVSSRREYFAEHETVLTEGDEGDSMYIIARGEVDVCIGDERRVVARLGPDDFFGEMSLMTGERRTATIVTRDGDGDFVVIDKPAFYELIRSNDALVNAMGDQLARRRESLAEKQRELAASAKSARTETRASFVTRIRRFFGA